VTLGDFGTQWHEAWVLVTILSENTGISHDAYSSVPSYTKTPPEYSFTLAQGPPLEEDDTGTVDSGGDSGGDTGPIDCCKEKGDDPDEDPECGCATGGPAGLGVVLLAMLAGLRRRR
jgi:MYXO-CTERM domain-containing protein